MEPSIKNIYYSTKFPVSEDMGFEEMYLAVREKECRLYSNEEVSKLPSVLPAHIHYYEWQIRKRSAKRLVKHLAKKKCKLDVLEIGCGNGWLSSKIAEVTDTLVTGIDINKTEILQAQCVFKYQQNIKFVSTSINNLQNQGIQFDCIVFAASIQYFKDLCSVLNTAISMLKVNGEIHILDTHFYSSNEEPKARTKTYYQQLGFPKMAIFYFHHRYKDLEGYNYNMLYNPGSLKNKLFLKKDPFPWIIITPECYQKH